MQDRYIKWAPFNSVINDTKIKNEIIKKHINSPKASSIGRLFDAVSVRHRGQRRLPSPLYRDDRARRGIPRGACRGLLEEP